jgi:hypothetical protein
MNKILLSESDVYNYFHENLSTSRSVETFDEYSLFKSQYPMLKAENSRERNIQLLKEYMMGQSVGGSILGFIDLFSAGSLSQCTLFALGISPAITASIVMQLAGFSFPAIEELTKEGEYGKVIINYYTRILSLILSLYKFQQQQLLQHPLWQNVTY